MYHPDIIARRIHNLEKKYNVHLTRYTIQQSRAATSILNKLYDPDEERLIRPLTSSEQAFIFNEILLSKCDFRYWFDRYVWIAVDDGRGGVRPATIWESQELLLSFMADWELEMWKLRDRLRADKVPEAFQKFDAICALLHKARQLGFTLICQALGVHRLEFYSGIRGLTASIDDQKTQDVHDRAVLMHSRLPFWMKSSLISKVKDRGLKFANGSYMALQDASQDAGLGQGNQWDFVHLTECASWDNPDVAIENHLFPAIAKSVRTIAFLESTAQGMNDWWHRKTEQARAGEMSRWHYLFVPWYAEPSKYIRYAPDRWEPNDFTKEHAKMVEATSPEFMRGRTVRLSKEQMYYWETEREAYRREGTLNIFLANYCATPEQSFQHSGTSSFDPELLEMLEFKCREPIPYDLYDSRRPQDDYILDSDNKFLKPYKIGDQTIAPIRTSRDELRKDPRGLILMWEPPEQGRKYIIGVDPADGLFGWTRNNKRVTGRNDKRDTDYDNAVIQVIKRSRFPSEPDIQVAEFAAPILPQDLVPYCNILGRLYGQHDDDGQAQMIIEVQPGPGGRVQHELTTRYNYYNFYQWKTFDGLTIKYQNAWGWHSNIKSVRELWTLGKYHIGALLLEPRSKYLVDEMRTCQDVQDNDGLRRRGAAVAGAHDDRVCAMLFALWAANDWSLPKLTETRTVDQQVTNAPFTSWQELDINYEQYQEMSDTWFYSQILDD